MRRAIPACFLIAAVLGWAPAVRASFITRPIWTLSPYVGASHHDASFQVEKTIPIGFRAGFTFLDRFGVEGSYGKTLAESARVPDRKSPIDQWGLDLTFDFAPEGWINPYAFFGWAQLSLDEPGGITLHLTGYEAGGGVKILLARDPVARWDLRIDGRGILAENEGDLDGAGRQREHVYLTVGIMMTMAGREESPDRDRDGIPDAVDRCPSTPRGARVDALGCPTDADGDGVPDGIDLCEHTPEGLDVDEVGCARDSDGDGVFDGRDLCPGTPPRVLTDGDGCPVPPRLSAVEAELLDAGFVALDGATFAAGSALVRSASQAVLDEVGRVLASRPAYEVEILGFADASEAGDKAQDLAERRAKAVRDNLLARRPDLAPERFRVIGRGGEGIRGGASAKSHPAARRVEIRMTNPGAARPKR